MRLAISAVAAAGLLAACSGAAPNLPRLSHAPTEDGMYVLHAAEGLAQCGEGIHIQIKDHHVFFKNAISGATADGSQAPDGSFALKTNATPLYGVTTIIIGSNGTGTFSNDNGSPFACPVGHITGVSRAP